MDREYRLLRHAAERAPVAVLAALASFLVFAAINAGFTAHAADLAAQAFGETTLGL
jgi:hypothetical protein